MDDRPTDDHSSAAPVEPRADLVPGGARWLLFPGCDPRGVLSRALAADAPDWSTRPDALLFGWMLALAPGIDASGAARALLAVHGSIRTDHDQRAWSVEQRALLQALRELSDAAPRNASLRERKNPPSAGLSGPAPV